MKHLLLLLMIAITAFAVHGQYYYPYDSSNYYYDDSPSLIIQKDKIMGWYVSDLDGKRISDYYEEIRPYSQNRAAVKDKIMGWCFIDISGKRVSDYYIEVDDYHDGYALVKDKVMGWTFVNKQGKRLVPDYFDEAYPFHRGVALVKDKVTTRANGTGNFISVESGNMLYFLPLDLSRQTYRRILPIDHGGLFPWIDGKNY